MSKPDTASLEYKNLVDLLSVFAEATSRLTLIQADLHSTFLESVDGVRDDYSTLQAKLTEAEAGIEMIARAHPEWFESARSIKTPYGVVKFHASTKLDAPNEEASIILIESKCSEEERAKFLRTETTLNLDALKELTDSQLRQFRINRIEVDNFSVKAATIDLGKAVKQAAEKEAA
jgi:hypothetical protein